MTALRSCPRLGFILALALVPLYAQNGDHDQKPSAPPHAIADGTTFLIRLEDKLDVSSVQPGKRFKAKLGEDMIGPDESMILHGSRVRGHVSAVGNGFHPHLLLSFDEIETQHGWAPLMATITAVPGEHGLRIGDEGEIEREGQGGSERHDPDSDGIGSTAGAAAGVVRAIFSDHRLQLQKGTILEVRLDRPLQVRWR
jgi:hypothetical protein